MNNTTRLILSSASLLGILLLSNSINDVDASILSAAVIVVIYQGALALIGGLTFLLARHFDLLPEEESKRIKVSDNPDYYIETYRGKIGNNPEKKGYSIVYSIKVDGFDISSVYKKNDIK